MVIHWFCKYGKWGWKYPESGLRLLQVKECKVCGKVKTRVAQ